MLGDDCNPFSNVRIFHTQNVTANTYAPTVHSGLSYKLFVIMNTHVTAITLSYYTRKCTWQSTTAQKIHIILQHNTSTVQLPAEILYQSVSLPPPAFQSTVDGRVVAIMCSFSSKT